MLKSECMQLAGGSLLRPVPHRAHRQENRHHAADDQHHPGRHELFGFAQAHGEYDGKCHCDERGHQAACKRRSQRDPVGCREQSGADEARGERDAAAGNAPADESSNYEQTRVGQDDDGSDRDHGMEVPEPFLFVSATAARIIGRPFEKSLTGSYAGSFEANRVTQSISRYPLREVMLCRMRQSFPAGCRRKIPKQSVRHFETSPCLGRLLAGSGSV